MSNKSDLLKSIVKKKTESFGTDPRDPWSAKSNIEETALLNRYLKSRGINPEFANKDTKVAHSKTNAFKLWLQAHQNDPVREETITGEHTPTGKRAHVLRKSKHYNTEIRVSGATKKLHSEAVDKKDTVTLDIPLLIRVLELAREDLKSDMDLHRVVEKLIEIRNKGTLTMDDYDTVAHIKEQYYDLIEGMEEDVFHGSTAATQMPFDNGNSPDDTISAKHTISKSAQIVKSLHKKLREEIYDHEKEDKSVATYGKKPKFQKPGLDSVTKKAPQAAAVRDERAKPAVTGRTRAVTDEVGRTATSMRPIDSATRIVGW